MVEIDIKTIVQMIAGTVRVKHLDRRFGEIIHRVGKQLGVGEQVHTYEKLGIVYFTDKEDHNVASITVISAHQVDMTTKQRNNDYFTNGVVFNFDVVFSHTVKGYPRHFSHANKQRVAMTLSYRHPETPTPVSEYDVSNMLQQINGLVDKLSESIQLQKQVIERSDVITTTPYYKQDAHPTVL